jgi:hypothetical protein
MPGYQHHPDAVATAPRGAGAEPAPPSRHPALAARYPPPGTSPARAQGPGCRGTGNTLMPSSPPPGVLARRPPHPAVIPRSLRGTRPRHPVGASAGIRMPGYRRGSGAEASSSIACPRHPGPALAPPWVPDHSRSCSRGMTAGGMRPGRRGFQRRSCSRGMTAAGMRPRRRGLQGRSCSCAGSIAKPGIRGPARGAPSSAARPSSTGDSNRGLRPSPSPTQTPPGPDDSAISLSPRSLARSLPLSGRTQPPIWLR